MQYFSTKVNNILKFVNIYKDKIEIGLNYSLNQNNAEYVPIKNYAFTETLEISRTFKGLKKESKIFSNSEVVYLYL